MQHPEMITDLDLLKHGILYESPCTKYTIRKPKGKNKRGFEVYKTGVTCSTRCGIVGYEGIKGFEAALKEIERRLKSE